MAGSVLDVASAAAAGQVFDLEDCLELERQISGKNSNGSAGLSEDQMRLLLCRINIIASLFRTQLALGRLDLPSERHERISNIEKYAVRLLDLLGSGVESSPNEIDMELLLEGGILEDPNIDFAQIVRSLQILALGARNGQGFLPIEESPTRTSDQNLYTLYSDLGIEYRRFWGNGSLIRISVNNDKGGPSVRFFQFTLSRILGKPVLARAVKDAMAKMKRDHTNLTMIYPVFFRWGSDR